MMDKIFYVLVYLFSCLLCLDASVIDPTDCHLNLIIPKDHLHAHCGKGHLHTEKNELESEIRQLKEEILDLRNLQVEQSLALTKQNCDNLETKISTLEEIFPKLVNYLQPETPQINFKLTDFFNKKKLVKLFKPFLLEELAQIEDRIRKDIDDKIRTDSTNLDLSMSWNANQNGRLATISSTPEPNPVQVHNEKDAYQNDMSKRKTSVQEIYEEITNQKHLMLAKNLTQKLREFQEKTEKDILAITNYHKKIEDIDIRQEIQSLTNKVEELRKKVDSKQESSGVSSDTSQYRHDEILHEVEKKFRQHGQKVGLDMTRMNKNIEEFQKHIEKLIENLTNEVNDLRKHVIHLNDTAIKKRDVKTVEKDIREEMTVEILKEISKDSSPIGQKIQAIKKDFENLEAKHESLKSEYHLELINPRLGRLSEKLAVLENKMNASRSNQNSENIECDTDMDQEGRSQIVCEAIEQNCHDTLEAMFIKHFTSKEEFQVEKVQFRQGLENLEVNVQALSVNTDNEIKGLNSSSENHIRHLQTDLRKTTEQVEILQKEVERLLEEIKKNRLNKLQDSLTNKTWVKYNFTSPKNIYNGCDGEKYIRRTNYSTAKFVGVVLCSSWRYKIYLSDSLDGVFLDVIDKYGSGEDHCEFVGGQQSDQHTTDPKGDFSSDEVYARTRWGSIPTRQKFRFLSIYPRWYECGLSIPS